MASFSMDGASQPTFNPSASLAQPAVPAFGQFEAGSAFGQGYRYEDPSLLKEFGQRCVRTWGFWGGRVVPAQVLQTKIDKLAEGRTGFAQPPFKQAQINTPLYSLVNGAFGPEHLLGWNVRPPSVDEAQLARSSWQNYKAYLGQRFNAPKITIEQAGGWRQAGSQLIINDFKGLVNAINLKQWLLAGSTTLGLALQGFSIANETKAGYERAKRAEDAQGGNGLAAINSGVISFGKAFVKSGIAWHLGNIGFRAGAILGGPFGALAGTLAGIAVGGIASVASRMALDEADKLVYGDPKNDLYA